MKNNNLAGIFILVFFIIIFFNRIVFTDLTYFQRDIMIQFKPWKMLINNVLSNIKLANSTYLDFLPLWNPYNHCGAPLLANLQTQLFYPLSIIFYLTKNFVIGYKIFLILHFILSAVFMYILLQTRKLNMVACIVGSIVWSCNGFILSRVEFLSVFSTVVWLPLLVYLIENFSLEFKIKNIIFLSLTIAIQFLAGHAQMWFYSILFVFLYSIFLSYNRKSWVAVCMLAFSIIGGIIISAIQFLPTIEFFYHSTRVGGNKILSSQFGLDVSEATLLSLNFKDLVNFFYPYSWQFNIKDFYLKSSVELTNYWAYTFYLGFTGMILGILGIYSLKSLKEKLFLIFSAVIFTLYALGKNFVLFFIIYEYIPIFRIFRYPSTGIYIPVFVLSFASGWGSEFFLSKIKRIFFKLNFEEIITVILPLVVFLELYLYSNKISLLLPEKILFHIGDNTKFLLSDKEIKNYRFALTPLTQLIGQRTSGKTLFEAFANYYDKLFGNTNLNYNIANFRGQDVELKDYYKFINFVYSRKTIDEAIPFFSIANVKYLLSIKKYPESRYVSLVSDREIKIYKNLYVLPRVYFVTKYIIEKDVDKTLGLMEKLGFKMLDTVILHNFDNYSNITLQHTAKTRYRISELDISTNRISFKFNNTTEGFLVVSQNCYPGWKCFVDGKQKKIFKSNIFMMSVLIPSGEHNVEFIYDPISFKLGCAITLVSILFILLYLFEYQEH